MPAGRVGAPLLEADEKPINVAVTNTADSNPKLPDAYDLAAVGSTKFLPAAEQTFPAGGHRVEMFCEAGGAHLTVDAVNILAWSTG